MSVNCLEWSAERLVISTGINVAKTSSFYRPYDPIKKKLTGQLLFQRFDGNLVFFRIIDFELKGDWFFQMK